ncbi:MAG: hypothetical protein EHM23_07285, partial [Acidobacteria bacterium]
MTRKRIISFGLMTCCLSYILILAIVAKPNVSNLSSTLRDCTGCHSVPANPSGAANFGNLPPSFTPGEAYSLNLNITGGAVYGFQIAAVYADGTSAGTLSSVAANTAVTSAGVLASTRALSSGVIDFQWTAPIQPKSAVSFKTYAMAANGNGGTSGDTTIAKEQAVPVAVVPPPNQPPLVTSVASQSSTVGAVVSLQIQASDPDGNPLTYGATNLPPGLSINATTGLISGTVSSSASGAYSVNVSVSDGTTTVAAAFSWNIAAAPYTEVLSFSQFGNGTGFPSAAASEQGRLYSLITLVNMSSSEPTHATLTIRTDDGNLMPVTLNGQSTLGSLDVTVPAAGSVLLRTDGLGDLKTGSVEVRSDKRLSGVIVVGGDSGRVAYLDNRAVTRFLAPVNESGFGTG